VQPGEQSLLVIFFDHRNAVPARRNPGQEPELPSLCEAGVARMTEYSNNRGMILKQKLSEILLAALREDLLRGRWAEALPGERSLVELYNVSRPTVRQALQRLKEEGVLDVSGRRTQILVPAAGKAGRTRRTPVAGSLRKRLIVISPVELDHMHFSSLLLTQRLGSLMAEAGHTVRLLHVPGLTARKPQLCLERLLHDEADMACCVVLSAPPQAQAFLHRRKIPCVLTGNPAPGIPLPAVSVNYEAHARHAAHHLLRLGHAPGRIVTVVSEVPFVGNEAVLRGVANALGSGDFPRALYQEGDMNLDAVIDACMIAKRRPTAWIVHRANAAIHVASRLLSAHQTAIPAQASVICLQDGQPLSNFSPQIAHYGQGKQSLARKVFDLALAEMESRRPAKCQFSLIFPLCKGGTLAPCRER
jgi:DNA-binding LacI/PurR family transcriptional regulator